MPRPTTAAFASFSLSRALVVITQDSPTNAHTYKSIHKHHPIFNTELPSQTFKERRAMQSHRLHFREGETMATTTARPKPRKLSSMASLTSLTNLFTKRRSSQAHTSLKTSISTNDIRQSPSSKNTFFSSSTTLASPTPAPPTWIASRVPVPASIVFFQQGPRPTRQFTEPALAKVAAQVPKSHPAAGSRPAKHVRLPQTGSAGCLGPPILPRSRTTGTLLSDDWPLTNERLSAPDLKLTNVREVSQQERDIHSCHLAPFSHPATALCILRIELTSRVP